MTTSLLLAESDSKCYGKLRVKVLYRCCDAEWPSSQGTRMLITFKEERIQRFHKA